MEHYNTMFVPKVAYNPYSYTDYKLLLKERLSDLRKSKPYLSWRGIAEKIPMQATYLSKALSNGKAHLSEDDLYCLCNHLEFGLDDLEYVLLLRAEATARDKGRREFLAKKIQDIRKNRVISADYVESQAQSMNHEMNYLLDPVTVIIHCSLHISKFKSNPTVLCALLGISQSKLSKSLEILRDCQYITLGKGKFEVESLQNKSPHFGRQHPLTRIHQAAMKSNLMSRLNQTSEDSKESFFATFTMDEKGFQLVKGAFEEFLRKTREIAKPARHDRLYKVYQLNFDLLEWF